MALKSILNYNFSLFFWKDSTKRLVNAFWKKILIPDYPTIYFESLVYSIARNPAQKNELLRYPFIGFSLVEASGMIGLVFGFVLLFGF